MDLRHATVAAGGPAMRLWGLVLLMLTGSLLGDQADAQVYPFDRDCVRVSDLDEAGVVRLPDLFRLFDAARTTTIDGFDWDATFGSPSGFDAADWVVLVDGQRVDVDVRGTLNLELLPVTLSDLQYVSLCEGPRFVHGEWIPGGALLLDTFLYHTGTGARNQVRGAAMIGNETGDPGPWRYTDRRVPNVDKFGPDAEFFAQRGHSGYADQLSAKLLRFYATDPAALARNLDAFDGDLPRMRLGALALRHVRNTERLPLGFYTASLHGSYANALDFTPAVAREVGQQQRLGQATVRTQTALPLFGELLFGLTASGAGVSVVPRGAALAFDPAWGERTLRLTLTPQVLGQTVTVSSTQRAASSPGFASSVWVHRLHLNPPLWRARRQRGEPERWLHRVGVGVGLVTDGTDWGGAVQVHGSTLGRRVMLRASAARILASERPDLSYWIAQGYRPTEPSRFTLGNEAPAVRTELAAEVRLPQRVRLGPVLLSSTALRWRHVDGLAAPVEAFRFGADGVALSGATRYTSGRGHLLHPSLSVRTQHAASPSEGWSYRTSARLFYDGQFEVGGNAAFAAAWARVPQHRAGIEATLSVTDRRGDPGRPAVFPDFTTRATFQRISGTRWLAYDGLSAATDGAYEETLSARWLLDLAFTKALLRNRVLATLGVRNLLGAEERYHPLGAALDLRLYGRASVRLTNLGPRP
ncbi:MAG: hypothetical protein AAGG50_07850 [Bacteroidota bacterium]